MNDHSELCELTAEELQLISGGNAVEVGAGAAGLVTGNANATGSFHASSGHTSHGAAVGSASATAHGTAFNGGAVAIATTSFAIAVA